MTMGPSADDTGDSTSAAALSQLSPEAYLVKRSRLVRPHDVAASKAWLLTAQLLFPQSMDIQREAYIIRRQHTGKDDAREAAKYLNNVIVKFGVDADPVIKDELASMVSALNGEPGSDPELVALFDALPRDTQEKVLLQSAQAAPDTLAYAKSMQFLFKRFPDLIPSLGGEFLNVVLAKFKKNDRPMGIIGPRDPLHHALVHDIIPAFLGVTKLKLEVELLQSILKVTLQYTHGYLQDLRDRRGSGPLPETWKTILSYVEEIGLRMGWSLSEDLSDISQESLWKRIRSFSAAHHKLEALTQLFYMGAILLFKTVSEFVIESRSTEGNGSESAEQVILVEAFMTFDYAQYQNSSDSSVKRRRLTTDSNDKVPLLTHGKLIGEEKSPLVRCFNHALNYFNLIFEDNGRRTKLANCLGDPNAFSFFAQDALHVMGDFRGALQNVRLLSSPGSSPADHVRNHVKLATLQFGLGDHAVACDHIIMAAAGCKALPASPSACSSKGRLLTQAHLSKSRHAHFMELTRDNVLAYCVRILIYELKDRAMIKDRDQTIGQILILLQYLYPSESDIYDEMLRLVRKSKGLNYTPFCTYVVRMTFLEDFAYLSSLPDFNLTLSPTTSPVAGQSSRRVGTRGANRGEKEEVRAALKRQVYRSHECMEDVIIEFFEGNKDAIMEVLL